ncbi:hypothetical protein [Nocardia sp. NBC_00511]|uniref:hypothetical protein n=1 Tax=Nocardia sp. NBC_00511 TaxID=2903591 RepID=UPI0030E5C795
MSRGQKPLTRVFFPRMKVRRPHRRRPWMLALYDASWRPYWYRKGSAHQRPRGFYLGDGIRPELATFEIPEFRWSGRTTAITEEA